MREILLVEDDEDIREMFAEVLREAGYVVREAENGQVALEQLERTNEPCLVLLDIMMPVMTGPELLMALHHKKRLSSLAVVALSAAARPEEVPHAKQFLRKPIEPDHLLEVVSQYCEPVGA